MLHTKRYRDTIAVLEKAGIRVISGDTAGSGNYKLRVQYGDIEAVAFTPGVTRDPRSRANTLFAVKMSLRKQGADFSNSEPEPEPEPAKDRKKATRLSGQEKADFFAFYKAGTGTLLELADLYRIHETTAGTIIASGERGELNNLLPEEYRVHKAEKQKPVIEVPRESYTDAPEPEPAPSPEPEPRPVGTAFCSGPAPKVNPLDPRLLNLAAEVKLMQERLAELQASAAALGITVVAELKVEWA